MKKLNIALASLLALGVVSGCEDRLDVVNDNQQTSTTFGNTADELQEAVIAAYNHTRMEGTYARVGYVLDAMRGDEVWNCGQVWYLPYDDLNVAPTDEIGCLWPWRDWYYTINVTNFILKKCDNQGELNENFKRIKGQALFLRGLSYYNLAMYYQNPALITDYDTYGTLDGLYCSNGEEGIAGAEAQQDLVLDQVEKDFKEAMELLPSRDESGEWAGGRATCGAAAGFYSRTLMFRHKYSEALTVLEDIINGKYGSYKLMDNYGDNFREGIAYENNAESLYEVQYLDYGQQGVDDEWTPLNTSANATQGHAVESNYGPSIYGGWGDVAVSPWLYNLFKAETSTKGNGLDPRLYWTCGTYEPQWEGFEMGNVLYTNTITANDNIYTNATYGGIPIIKNTNAREGLYEKIVQGLHCGVNLRLMRYSDVLLRAAECENEVNGPTAKAIGWIDQVRSRAGLKGLAEANPDALKSKDDLFEQIANVERPKEFGGEWGRGADLIRWGFFYDAERRAQMIDHASFCGDPTNKDGQFGKRTRNDGVTTKSSYDNYELGHEYFPIAQSTLNANPNLVGNSANTTGANPNTVKYEIHPIPAWNK
ncbi:MAG: RagB/SusD family nutrient uptake outer membrane protein [Bacteroidales bacterium]|nr:RagB/SusD family nutrient uptake outer membrane protein [Bacteroidales bacterium]